MSLRTSIEKLMQRQNLDAATCQAALHEMLAESTEPLQIAAFLTALRAKTETAEELAGLIAALKQKMMTIVTPHSVLDIVGTGGDGANTINISTGSAILAASCGVKIAKHGNRAVSSAAGSADVLAALGINIELAPEKIAAGIDQIGIGFCFSPRFHPAMNQLRDLRRKLNIPTTFNLLGPLLNPANPDYLILGVFNEPLLPLMAQTLMRTGVKRAVVVHSGGLDEISCASPAKILEISPTGIAESVIDPQKLGLARCTVTDLRGGDAHTNAQILLAVFAQGQATQYRAIAETLILNAAVALYLYGLQPSIAAAIAHAKEHLYSGHALTLLNHWIEFSHD